MTKTSSENSDEANPPSPTRGGQSLRLVAGTPKALTRAQQIENGLSNPLAHVRLAMQARAAGYGPTCGNVMGPDKTLAQLKQSLDVSWAVLDSLTQDLEALSRGQAGFELRTEARGLLREASDWIMLTVMTRSQNASEHAEEQPLTVPEHAIGSLSRLAIIGRQLAMAWHEIELARVPNEKTSRESLDANQVRTERRGAPVEGVENPNNPGTLPRANQPSPKALEAVYAKYRDWNTESVRAVDLAKDIGKPRQFLRNHLNPERSPGADPRKLDIAGREGTKQNSPLLIDRKSILRWLERTYGVRGGPSGGPA